MFTFRGLDVQHVSFIIDGDKPTLEKGVIEIRVEGIPLDDDAKAEFTAENMGPIMAMYEVCRSDYLAEIMHGPTVGAHTLH